MKREQSVSYHKVRVLLQQTLQLGQIDKNELSVFLMVIWQLENGQTQKAGILTLSFLFQLPEKTLPPTSAVFHIYFDCLYNYEQSQIQHFLNSSYALAVQQMEAEIPIATDPALSGGSHQTEMDKCSGLHRNQHLDTYIPKIKIINYLLRS